MVETIGPMVRGAKSPRVVEAAHLVGGALGGLASGAAAGALGAAFHGVSRIRLHGSALVALAVLIAVALVWEMATGGRKLGPGRQTPKAWRHLLRPGEAAFAYGVDLGLGVTTRVYFTSVFVSLGAAFFTGHALVGGLIGGAFGIARSATVVALVHGAGPEIDESEKLATRTRTVRAVNGIALVQLLVFVLVASGIASSGLL